MFRRVAFAVVLASLVLAPAMPGHPASAIGVHRDGRVFFVDTGGGVFSIEADGKVVRRDGPAFHWFALDADGRFRSTPWPYIPGGELRAVGTDPTVVLSSDVPVTIGGDTFYFPERGSDGRAHIIAVDARGKRTERAVLPPVHSAGRAVAWVNGLAPGPNGSVYYSEDRAVRKIDARGRVTLIAGVTAVPRCAAIPGIGAELRPYLRGLAVAPDGTVYVAASGCGGLLRIDRRGTVTLILRTAAPWSPTDVAFANGEVFVLEYLHTASDDRREWLPRVRRIGRDGKVVTLAQTTWR